MSIRLRTVQQYLCMYINRFNSDPYMNNRFSLKTKNIAKIETTKMYFTKIFGQKLTNCLKKKKKNRWTDLRHEKF